MNSNKDWRCAHILEQIYWFSLIFWTWGHKGCRNRSARRLFVVYLSCLIWVSDSFLRRSITQHYFVIMPLTFYVISLCNKNSFAFSKYACLPCSKCWLSPMQNIIWSVADGFCVMSLCRNWIEHIIQWGVMGHLAATKTTASSLTEAFCVASPGVLLRILKVLGDEGKVLAQFQPQVRLWHPAIVGMDGMVLGQLPCD